MNGGDDELLEQYLLEVRAHPLLTAEDEGRLGKMIRDATDAAEALDAGEIDGKKLTPAQRRKCVRQVRAGEEARRQFIQANLRLVVSIARRYRGLGLPLSDLIQEGNLGLIRAVGHFDYRKGFKFSTYATWWIRQALSKAISDTGATIRIPAHVGDVQSRIAKTEAELMPKIGRKPTLQEISDASGLTMRQINQVIDAAPRTVSLSSPTRSDSDGGELEDLVADAGAVDPFDMAASALNRTAVGRALAKLSAREQEVLAMRFGLDDAEALTLDQLSMKFDVTRERVRQIEAKALSKLRHPCMPPQLRQLSATIA